MAKATTTKTNVPAKAKAASAPAKVDERTAALPDFMRDDAGKGSQNIGAEDIGTPRLKLMQGLSKELQAYDGLKAGQFFHAAEEFIFPGAVIAVPIFFAKRYLLWKPLEDGGGILARADDAIHWSPPNVKFDVKLDKKDGGKRVVWETRPTVKESGLAEWGSMNPDDPQSPPAATLMYEYVCCFPEHPELAPAVLTFQRSSVKKAKTGVNDKLKLGRAPIFGRIFKFEPVEDTNSVGQKFFNIQPSAAGLVQDEDLYRQYRELNAMFEASGLKVADEESLQGEQPDDAGGGATNARY
jgi:hypothetical protein